MFKQIQNYFVLFTVFIEFCGIFKKHKNMGTKQKGGFNIRIYGVLKRNNQFLLCAEERLGFKMIKFPGGGLKFGEGIVDCLQREWFEETGYEIDKFNHIYTTEHFQLSAFSNRHQLISIYYQVECSSLNHNYPFEINAEEGLLKFYWQEIDEMLVEDLTFPIDKIVAKMFLK